MLCESIVNCVVSPDWAMSARSSAMARVRSCRESRAAHLFDWRGVTQRYFSRFRLLSPAVAAAYNGQRVYQVYHRRPQTHCTFVPTRPTPRRAPRAAVVAAEVTEHLGRPAAHLGTCPRGPISNLVGSWVVGRREARGCGPCGGRIVAADDTDQKEESQKTTTPLKDLYRLKTPYSGSPRLSPPKWGELVSRRHPGTAARRPPVLDQHRLSGSRALGPRGLVPRAVAARRHTLLNSLRSETAAKRLSPLSSRLDRG